jgi:hypothetical protein
MSLQVISALKRGWFLAGRRGTTLSNRRFVVGAPRFLVQRVEANRRAPGASVSMRHRAGRSRPGRIDQVRPGFIIPSRVASKKSRVSGVIGVHADPVAWRSKVSSAHIPPYRCLR